MSTDSFDDWRERAAVDTYTPLSREQLAEMFTATCKYGSGNCWTGVTGTLAKYVRLLMREREVLVNELEATRP